jgi:hypothetical protein
MALDDICCFDMLPQHVACDIYSRLSPPDMARAAQACRSWRARFPSAALVQLTLPVQSRFPTQSVLRECVNLQLIRVQSNQSEAWRGLLGVLQRERLPQLRRLVIEYWAGGDHGLLEELVEMMKVGWWKLEGRMGLPACMRVHA